MKAPTSQLKTKKRATAVALAPVLALARAPAPALLPFAWNVPKSLATTVAAKLKPATTLRLFFSQSQRDACLAQILLSNIAQD